MQDDSRFASIDGMKRLVVCCDGTWNKPDNETITNVEKIARTVQGDPTVTDGIYQLVYYVSGVGAGSYGADRLLGGAFGFGLFHNVIASYRFLAQNYAPGDEIRVGADSIAAVVSAGDPSGGSPVTWAPDRVIVQGTLPGCLMDQGVGSLNAPAASNFSYR